MDAKSFFEEFAKIPRSLKLERNDEWISRCRSWRDNYPVCIPEYKKQGSFVNSYAFVDLLSSYFLDNDTVVTDMGTSFTCVHQAIKLKKNQRFFTSSGLASMGYGLPAAIGAICAKKSGRVILIVGDGALQMNIQELVLIKSYCLSVKIFVINNEGYLSIRKTQDAIFNSLYVASSPELGLKCPPIQKIAEAYGIKSKLCKTLSDVKQALDEDFHSSIACLYEIMMSRDQPLVPKSSVSKLPDGGLVSRPLEDLFPFLPREEFKKNMIIKALKASE